MTQITVELRRRSGLTLALDSKRKIVLQPGINHGIDRDDLMAAANINAAARAYFESGAISFPGEKIEVDETRPIEIPPGDEPKADDPGEIQAIADKILAMRPAAAAIDAVAAVQSTDVLELLSESEKRVTVKQAIEAQYAKLADKT